METKGFSVGEVVKEGWRGMKKQWLFFIFFLLAVLIIPLIPEAIAAGIAINQYHYSFEQLHKLPMWVNAIVSFFHIVLTLLVTVGMIKVSLACADHEKGKFRYLFSGFPLIVKLAIGEILYYLVMAIGLVLFVIPGVVFGLRYGQFAFFIVDRGVGPIEAFKLSRKATDGAKWDLLAFFIISLIIAFLGILALFIGIFIAIPVLMVAQGVIFRTLVRKTYF